MTRCRRKVHPTREGAMIAIKKHAKVEAEVYFCRKCMCWHWRPKQEGIEHRERQKRIANHKAIHGTPEMKD